MGVTEADIVSLVRNTSYTPSSIPVLEDYLSACCEGQVGYIFDAVRTLLKLYQLFPGDVEATKTIRHVKVGHACMLAMLEFPNITDLLALSYMIPQTVTMKEPCSYVFKCAEHLKSCHFADFWKVYNTSLLSTPDPVVKQLATKSVGRMQESILCALSLSYKRAPVDVVKAACNVDNLDTIVHASSVVESVTPESVIFKATSDNTKRQRVYQEGVSFQTISSLLSKMAQ